MLARFVVFWLFASIAAAAEPEWQSREAANYLESRQTAWFEYKPARRGEAENATTCVSCHTTVPFALALPVLRQAAGETGDNEKKLLEQVSLRVRHWSEIETSALRLMYDTDDEKCRQSFGTEAIHSALILALDDRSRGRPAPSDVTRQAFVHLWQLQLPDGSWPWLNFGYEPWEANNSRYYGACVAAIAIGKEHQAEGVERLREFLKSGFARENHFNRAWALWGDTAVGDVLSPKQRQETTELLLGLQRADGGWSLCSLGNYHRVDKTEPATDSDGLATGLVIHVLLTSGAIAKNHPAISKGLIWLQANQQANGSWRCQSANKQRDPTSHVGQFMNDAATAFAVLALSN